MCIRIAEENHIWICVLKLVIFLNSQELENKMQCRENESRFHYVCHQATTAGYDQLSIHLTVSSKNFIKYPQ